jgi:signal transduction histidine kinase
VSTRSAVDSPPSFSSVIHTAGNVAALAAGAVVFLPAAIFLVLTGSGSPIDWAAWGIPLAIWLLSLLVRTRARRAGIQAAAGFLLVLAIFLDPGSEQWISVTTICFAVIVGAIFNLPTKGAAVVVVIATVLDLVIGVSGESSRVIFGVVQLAPWAGGALQLFAGGGLLLAWHSWMRNVRIADHELETMKQVIEDEHQASASQAGTAAVARRIHETILNTLAAISMGVEPNQESEAKQACRRDLDQMNRDLQELGPCSLEEVISTALETIQPSPLKCHLDVEGALVVAAPIANALHDALVEALRNIERHSGQVHARIHVRVADCISITVSDKGVGASPAASERFGLRNSMRSNMSTIGGQSSLQRNDDGGTTVTLIAPLRLSSPRMVPNFPILGAADGTLLGRLGAAGTNIFMLAILIPVLTVLPSPVPVAVATLAFVGSVLALAFAWTSRWRPLLNWVGIALLSGPFIVVATTPLDCSASPALQGMVSGSSGGAVLLLLVANRALYRRILISALTIVASLAATLSLPIGCRSESVITVVVNVIYLAAIVAVLTWIDLRFDVRRAQAQDAWQVFVEDEASRERQAAVARGWHLIGPGTRDLLEGIADGSLPISNSETRTRAAAESASIRAALGLSLEPGDTFGSLTRRMIRVARQVGATIDAEALTPARRSDRLPDKVVSLLEGLVRQCAGQTVVLRAFTDEESDEITITLPVVATFLESVQFIDDVAIQAEIFGEQTIVMVRRAGRRES